MNKLKYDVFKKLINVGVTHAELSFILYMCMNQDTDGIVTGVYYKDTMIESGISHETFYNVLESLKAKGVISFVRTLSDDYDITVMGNDFSDGDYSKGYLSLRKKVFRSPSFKKLKVNEQLLIMDLLCICQSNHGKYKIGVDKYIQNYMNIFHVSSRTIRKYLRAVKKFFEVSRDQGIYTIIPKKMLKVTVEHSDEQGLHTYLIKTMARRHRIKHPTVQEITETAKLVNQYRCYAEIAGCNIWSVLQDCLESSIDIINQYKKARDKKEYSLRYKLIHKLVRQALKMA